MNTFYYLSTCDTCKRIIKELNLPLSINLVDIKKNPLSEKDLEDLYHFTNSYNDLINRRAQLFKKKGIDPKTLTESDAKMLLLEHYTFLKRPVLLLNEAVFVGNSKQNIEAIKNAI